ncbi:hypothetical protein C8Q76DRAFT_768859 [Earliella scabrosa]|nr:hypothetical protein C8Q76DRAFT_768859 [Earliella scabrosa]
MSAYYFQRRPPSASRDSSAYGSERREHSGVSSSHDTTSADRSIYIFPSPSSAPPSPYPTSPGSSFSAPTDFEPSDAFSFGSRSRTTSNTPSTAVSPSEGAEEGAEEDAAVTRRDVSPLADDELEIDVELWELSTDPDRLADASDTDSSWVLEDEIERVSAGDIDVSFVHPTRQPRRLHKLSAPSSPDAAHMHHFWAVRPQRRARTQSRMRTISSLSSSRAPSSTRRPAPNPRIHIPLLSFFASLLSVDLDDPALRLLTHADPGEADSVLFPGLTTSQLLAAARDESSDAGRQHDTEGDAESESSLESNVDSPDDESQHGLPKMLLASISDQSAVALRSLREGLAVYVPHSPEVALPIPIPAPSELLGLWRVVGEVCVRGGQAWREVWAGARVERPLR